MANLVPLSGSSLLKQQKSAIIKPNKFFSSKLKIKTTGVQSSGGSIEGSEILNEIVKKVIQIDKILKNTLLISKKEGEKKRVSGEQKDFSEREKELEKNKPKAIPGIKLPSPPRMGIFDWIKNFVTQTILGFFVVRLIEHLPKLLSLLPKIIKVTDFITDVGGRMVDRLIGFVDWGYKAIDGTRGFIKKMGGEGWAQNFDKFAGAIDNLIEVAIITALVTADSGGFGGRKPGAPGAPGKPGVPYKYDRFGAAVQRNYGHAGRQIYQNARLNGKTHKQALEAVRRAVRQGRIVGAPQTGSLAGTQSGSRILGRGLTRAPQRLATQTLIGALGKGGAKTVLRLAKPLLGRIPIIGGLLEFGLSWVLGDPIGKAAFRGIGTVLIGAVGAAIGGPIGAAIGGLAGAEVGGKLYEMFFENKKPQGTAVKAAGGGKPTTRGGRPVSGPAKRTIKKKKAPRTLRATPPALRPGSMVGGEKKIQQIYPESKDKTKMSPFDFLKQSYEVYSRSTGLGALAALAIKPLMGDKPSYADYKNAGTGVNNWMNQSIASGTLAYAGGGEVKMESIVSGEDYSDVIAKSLQDSVAPQTDKIIQDLMKQLMLKPQEVEKDKQKMTTPDAGPAPIGGVLTIEQLVGLAKGAGFNDDEAVIMAAIAMAESGGNSAAHNKVPPDNSYGLWQINMIGNLGPERLRQFGISNNEQLFDPVTNAKAAFLIKQSQGFNAWTVHKSGAYRNHLQSARAARGAPRLTTSPQMGGPIGAKGIVEYITGDPNTPVGKFDRAGHGTPNNYHDHIAFATIQDKERAKTALRAAGIKIGSEFRPGDPGYHGANLAIDIPGYQWRGAGAIGEREYQGSKRVRQILGLGVSKYQIGGKTIGFRHFGLLAENGPEFVIDADSTAALEQNIPGFLDALNKAKYNDAIKILQNYASYHNPTQVIKITKQVPVPVPVGGSGGGAVVVSSGGVNNNMFETLAQVG